LKAFVAVGPVCHDGSTDGSAKPSNFRRKEIVHDAVRANTAPLKAIKATWSNLTVRGQDRSAWPNERNQPRELMTPAVLVDGVVSSTGWVS